MKRRSLSTVHSTAGNCSISTRKPRFAFASFFFRALSLDGQRNLAAHRSQKFQVPLRVGIFVLRSAAPPERRSSPRECATERPTTRATACRPVPLRLAQPAVKSAWGISIGGPCDNVSRAAPPDLLWRRRLVELVCQKTENETSRSRVRTAPRNNFPRRALSSARHESIQQIVQIVRHVHAVNDFKRHLPLELSTFSLA